MRDEAAFVERLQRELREVSWPEPAELRARARRRSRRTAGMAAVAVLAVASAAVVLPPRAGVPELPPVAPGPAVHQRTEIPVEAVLVPADLPARTDLRLDEVGLGEPVRADEVLRTCAQAQGAPADETVSRYSRSQSLIGADERDGAAYRRAMLSQVVYRLDGDPNRVFDELDRLVGACRSWTETTQVQQGEQAPVTARLTHHWTVARRDFAGDQAVLIQHTYSQPVDPVTDKPVGVPPGAQATLVVRVGDLVSVLVPAQGLPPWASGTDLSDAQLVDVARAAARRMCVAANPGC
ncbi:hypothetical protein K7640_06315 [Micromonospora sp. PLK6-60]|uniref:hypothetical protein n=1 Tax=Micromonospora sp. PLK6-60 TaxID=2873383 RepID=UPI001CA7919A|nr:hypothetical protein [Micromonospora sp. PLK6-60]MBY8871458.1 hypothetical protein [Micromonospora sp. PLK6-60]